MNNALKLCSLALSPNPTSPTSGMIQVENGYASAYGGLFTIRVPVSQNIGAGFNPRALSNFFRKERTKVAYTIKFPKLTVSEGKERLTIDCVPAEDIAIIDCIEKATETSLNVKLLKIAAELSVVDGQPYAAGVTFKDGNMMATNNKVFFCGESGLSAGFNFMIHKEAALALTKFKSPVVSVAKNDHLVKFNFKDGCSLCAHILAAEFPDITPLFNGDWVDFSVEGDVAEIDCDEIQIRGGSLFYLTEKTIGELEGVVTGNVELKCLKKNFDYLLGGELSFCGTRIQSVGENWVFISSVLK